MSPTQDTLRNRRARRRTQKLGGYLGAFLASDDRIPFESRPDPKAATNERAVQLLIDAGLIEDDDPNREIPWTIFRVGTCEGQWRETGSAYEVLSFVNRSPGNGHFAEALRWFAFASAMADFTTRPKPVRILAVLNPDLGRHLETEWGFEPDGDGLTRQFTPADLPTL